MVEELIFVLRDTILGLPIIHGHVLVVRVRMIPHAKGIILVGLHSLYDISVLLGGWLDEAHTMNGRWNIRSVSTHSSYPNNWSSFGEYENPLINNGNRSEGFANPIVL